jgi:hypothetical protein
MKHDHNYGNMGYKFLAFTFTLITTIKAGMYGSDSKFDRKYKKLILSISNKNFVI